MSKLRNDKHQIIKKLAIRSIKSDGNRNIFTIITVAIAVSLIMTVLLSVLSAKNEQTKQAGSMPQYMIYDVDEEILDSLENDRTIEKIVAMFQFETVALDHVINVNRTYFDNPSYFDNMKLTGTLPEKKNEIMLSEGSLKFLSPAVKLGDEISIDFGSGEENYQICGIVTLNSERPNNIEVYCSKDYMLANITSEKIKYTASLYMKNAQNMTKVEAEKEISLLAGKHHIETNKITLSGQYFSIMEQNLSTSEILQIILIASVILLAAALVIYSIFYILVSSKISEYGRFRTIGMTKKQIYKMVIQVGCRLALYGCFIGIIAGGFLGYIIRPNGWNWMNAIISAIISGIFGIFMVFFSVKVPAKAAGNASPIEAISYTGYSLEKNIKKRKNCCRKITPYRLAVLNLKRSLRKTVMIIFSLSFAGILLICCASMQKSISSENMARTLMFQYGNFKVEFEGDRSILGELDHKASEYSVGSLQAYHNPMTPELSQKILAIDGVKDIKVWNGTTTIFSNIENRVSDQSRIWGYTYDDVGKLGQCLKAGTVDYDELIKNNGIVVNISENVFEDVYHWIPELGDKITLSFWNNGEIVSQDYTILGITDGQDGFGGLLRIPLNSLNKATNYNCALQWEIITDNSKDSEIELALENFIENNSDFTMITFKDYVESLADTYKTGIFAMYFLTIFIGCFGIINLINLTITNQIMRKKEIGIMQAIGMTRKQLYRTNIVEGELIVFLSLTIVLCVGTPIGYIVCNSFKSLGVIRTFSFPFLGYLLFSMSLIMVQLMISYFLNKNLHNKSLIEQISDVN